MKVPPVYPSNTSLETSDHGVDLYNEQLHHVLLDTKAIDTQSIVMVGAPLPPP